MKGRYKIFCEKFSYAFDIDCEVFEIINWYVFHRFDFSSITNELYFLEKYRNIWIQISYKNDCSLVNTNIKPSNFKVVYIF